MELRQAHIKATGGSPDRLEDEPGAGEDRQDRVLLRQSGKRRWAVSGQRRILLEAVLCQGLLEYSTDPVS